MSYYYNAEDNGFYIDGVHSRIPVSAKKIEAEVYLNLSGKVIEADGDGNPVICQPVMPSIIQLMERTKSNLRTMRAPMLDALTGIAGRATRAGNDALAVEADALAVKLLAITDDAALNAATTYEAMQAAGSDAMRRIADGAGRVELVEVFRIL